MLAQSREWARARPVPPFANGAEGEVWQRNWCGRCRHEEREGCPLLTIAICGETPAAWRATGSGETPTKYRCLEWMPRRGV